LGKKGHENKPPNAEPKQKRNGSPWKKASFKKACAKKTKPNQDGTPRWTTSHEREKGVKNA